MQIHGFNKTTLLDYPKHIAATIFIGSCNMRCPFCHNASLVEDPNSQPIIPTEEVLSYLKKRHTILEGVCVSGGEPTLYPELPAFIAKIKEIGLKVKLDTNGTNPIMLKNLAENKLIDYVAMDIKNSLKKYPITVGFESYPTDKISESVAFLLSTQIDYEFRTTLVKELHQKEDMLEIGKWIKGAKAYFLQAFIDSGDIISKNLSPLDKETMLEYKSLLEPYVDYIALRGID